MTLHLINKSLTQSSALEECIAVLQAKKATSALLLIEDAVYSVRECSENHSLHEKIKALGLPCYILKENLQVRGLKLELADCFSLVDYAGFVQLSLDYDKVQSWS
ncbi:sulfurtransferase complex subunit TusB [Haliea sp. AH-315-K21]|uniref:Sulfurtransferase complex subunit TusB n=1 Tax=SAR86 cluster bacterium TaxID=2030880 RepID=A0A2A5CEB0_9GAMM|nr:sulfurtransferase complex subunit TusB [Haliea sp. AH-315-K21]MBN4076013.1 sulfurtransferase complex subunit TusB [Gammaproteobacteria bacterium AH-315-E17]PCJ42073.1 MAG: sulfurtransferase complex subunit TusB [SAR86 cluster bacterium]